MLDNWVFSIAAFTLFLAMLLYGLLPRTSPFFDRREKWFGCIAVVGLFVAVCTIGGVISSTDAPELGWLDTVVSAICVGSAAVLVCSTRQMDATVCAMVVILCVSGLLSLNGDGQLAMINAVVSCGVLFGVMFFRIPMFEVQPATLLSKEPFLVSVACSAFIVVVLAVVIPDPSSRNEAGNDKDARVTIRSESPAKKAASGVAASGLLDVETNWGLLIVGIILFGLGVFVLLVRAAHDYRYMAMSVIGQGGLCAASSCYVSLDKSLFNSLPLLFLLLATAYLFAMSFWASPPNVIQFVSQFAGDRSDGASRETAGPS